MYTHLDDAHQRCLHHQHALSEHGDGVRQSSHLRSKSHHQLVHSRKLLIGFSLLEVVKRYYKIMRINTAKPAVTTRHQYQQASDRAIKVLQNYLICQNDSLNKMKHYIVEH